MIDLFIIHFLENLIKNYWLIIDIQKTTLFRRLSEIFLNIIYFSKFLFSMFDKLKAEKIRFLYVLKTSIETTHSFSSWANNFINIKVLNTVLNTVLNSITNGNRGFCSKNSKSVRKTKNVLLIHWIDSSINNVAVFIIQEINKYNYQH